MLPLQPAAPAPSGVRGVVRHRLGRYILATQLRRDCSHFFGEFWGGILADRYPHTWSWPSRRRLSRSKDHLNRDRLFEHLFKRPLQYLQVWGSAELLLMERVLHLYDYASFLNAAHIRWTPMDAVRSSGVAHSRYVPRLRNDAISLPCAPLAPRRPPLVVACRPRPRAGGRRRSRSAS